MHRSLVLLGVSGWALGCAPPSPPADRPASARVRPGIEVLLSDSVELVRGRRVGLVSNQSGVDSRGTSDVTRLRDAGIDLVALFSPEHGFRGAAAPGAVVASSVDSATGLPIYSLYGRTSAPTDEMLEGIDVMLVDLQDAGARYYTYLFTTIEVMKAAARKNVAVVVLDRPNPIGGIGTGKPARSGIRVGRWFSGDPDAAWHDAGRAGSAGQIRSPPRGIVERRPGRGLASHGFLRSDRTAVRSPQS